MDQWLPVNLQILFRHIRSEARTAAGSGNNGVMARHGAILAETLATRADSGKTEKSRKIRVNKRGLFHPEPPETPPREISTDDSTRWRRIIIRRRWRVVSARRRCYRHPRLTVDHRSGNRSLVSAGIHALDIGIVILMLRTVRSTCLLYNSRCV